MGRDTNKFLAWIDFIRTGCLILDWLPFRNNCMRTFAFGETNNLKILGKNCWPFLYHRGGGTDFNSNSDLHDDIYPTSNLKCE